MKNLLPSEKESLQQQVESLLQLLRQDATLRQIDTSLIRSALDKAISPTFEIVFAGAFSAGKSMLINALLGRKLLYSAQALLVASSPAPCSVPGPP